MGGQGKHGDAAWQEVGSETRSPAAGLEAASLDGDQRPGAGEQDDEGRADAGTVDAWCAKASETVLHGSRAQAGGSLGKEGPPGRASED